MTENNSREATPAITSVPQKRALEDDHQPAVSSPLNPTKDDAPARAARAKKESFKKREAKGREHTPDPKTPINQKDSSGPLRYNLPPPKPTDFEAPHGPVFLPNHNITSPDGKTVEFVESSDHVLNKRSYRYIHCIADPAFPSTHYYRQSETEPFGPRINFEDTAAHMFIDETGKHITTNKGFRMAKANVSAREGRYYWECKITSGIPKRRRSDGSTNGHVRMGWARREATLESIVGFDAYSYGIRDVAGQKVYLSRPKDFFPAGEDIVEGDVIGLEINLPSENLHRKVVEGNYNSAVDLDDDDSPTTEAADTVRDRVPIRFKSHLYFEQIDYHPVKELEELANPSPIISSTGNFGGNTQAPSPNHSLPALRTLPNSYIKIYKNGTLVGTAFKDLLAFLPPASKPQSGVGARDGLDDGMLGYFPAISVFRGGAAEMNLGPDFWFPPPSDDGQNEVDMIGSDQPPAAKAKRLIPMSERYDEQIVEDIVHDIVDEVDFWMQDGGVSGKGARRFAAPATTTYAMSNRMGSIPSEEIKELVQDDE